MKVGDVVSFKKEYTIYMKRCSILLPVETIAKVLQIKSFSSEIKTFCNLEIVWKTLDLFKIVAKDVPLDYLED